MRLTTQTYRETIHRQKVNYYPLSLASDNTLLSIRNLKSLDFISQTENTVKIKKPQTDLNFFSLASCMNLTKVYILLSSEVNSLNHTHIPKLRSIRSSKYQTSCRFLQTTTMTIIYKFPLYELYTKLTKLKLFLSY